MDILGTSLRVCVGDLNAAIDVYERLTGAEAIRFQRGGVAVAAVGCFFLMSGPEAELSVLRKITATLAVQDVDEAVADLKAGAKVKGTTIAELGNGNKPLDMIVYTKDGKDYLLMANSKHGVLKIPTTEFATAAPITAKTGVAGVKAETVKELVDVVQLDKLDDTHAILLYKNGDLKTVPLP